VVGAPASARILKTRRPAQGGALPLTIGGGFEYETDTEESNFGFPFLLEYKLSDRLTLSAEPSYETIRAKPGQAGTSMSGSGDFETTAEWEFLSERRHRPGLTAEGVIKFPTAAHADLGTHEYDFALGLVASKEFVGFDLDLSALYTFVGDPPGVPLENALEISVASEWHLRPALDVEMEVVTSRGGGVRGRGSLGGFGGVAGAIGASENVTEGTVGLAEHLNDFFKLEQGAVAKSDGSWQIVFAWEWDFSGQR
jgi:hypothetical protein